MQFNPQLLSILANAKDEAETSRTSTRPSSAAPTGRIPPFILNKNLLKVMQTVTDRNGQAVNNAFRTEELQRSANKAVGALADVARSVGVTKSPVEAWKELLLTRGTISTYAVASLAASTTNFLLTAIVHQTTQAFVRIKELQKRVENLEDREGARASAVAQGEFVREVFDRDTVVPEGFFGLCATEAGGTVNFAVIPSGDRVSDGGLIVRRS